MELIEEPLTNPLTSITKKYLSMLSHTMLDLEIDRYHYAILLIGKHSKHLTQKALTELLQIDKSYTVTIINYLSEHGYVTREKNPSDKREQVLKLTEKAKQAIPEIRKSVSAINNHSFRNLTSEQIEIFRHVLKVVHENLSKPTYLETIINIQHSAD